MFSNKNKFFTTVSLNGSIKQEPLVLLWKTKKVEKNFFFHQKNCCLA